MRILSPHWLGALTGAIVFLTSAVAQDTKALVDALVRKGVLTTDEAAALVAEVKAAPQVPVSSAGSKFLKQLTLSGRFQVQYASLGTTIDGASAQPASTDHFFLRRMLLGTRAEFTDHWSGTVSYDLANGSFDAGYLSWKPGDLLAVDVGLRKVPFILDEFSSSLDIRAIERSAMTRYFVETNNGRRLGAGSYRVGVFAGGKLPWAGLYYNVAVTNPERDETFSGVSSAGNRANNRQAFWGDVGLANRVAGVNFRLGVSGGYLPDQGGRATGVGDNLAVAGAYLELQTGGLLLRTEYAWADAEHGVSPLRSAHPYGYYVMPCYRLGRFEAVLRYSYVDSDGHGIDLSDGIRSAPTSGTLDRMSEWFIGGNYYFHDNDTKLQLGYVRGEAKDALTGAPLKATTQGVRSQLQINF